MINEILKMMRRSIGNQCSCFRHSELLRLGLRRASLARLFREWISEAEVEMGVAVVQTGEDQTARAEVVSTERNGQICRIAQMRWLHDLII